MTPELHPVISQRTYPGVDPRPNDPFPDIDDCQFIAAIWAATGADPEADRPALAAFREAAGKPDRVGVDGANVDDAAKGIPVVWPGQPFTKIKSLAWASLQGRLDAGDHVSLSVLSSALPPRYRFGFMGPHQVGVVKRLGRYFLANPLADDGSQPLEISLVDLKAAARALARNWILAIAFRQVPRWEVRVMPGVWGRYRFVGGELRRRRLPTLGFTARCGAPEQHRYDGKVRTLVRIRSGRHKGDYANRGARLVRVRSRNL